MYMKNTLGTLILSIAFTIAPITQAATDAIDVKTVVSEGLGSDVASAAQNAAQNALIDVVGSFMDSTKILEKRVEIQDGVRSQTSKINTNIKEYSQGSIQSFEIVKVSQQDRLTKVTAKVAVRMEDFRAYIEKLAHGETSFDGTALSAQAKQLGAEIKAKESNALKQKENKSALLFDNVLRPVLTGQVIQFEVGTPVLAAKQVFSKKEPYLKRSFEDMAKKFGAESIFLIRVTASLNKDYISNIKDTLGEISNQYNYDLSMFGKSFNSLPETVFDKYQENSKNKFIVTLIDGDLNDLAEIKNSYSKKFIPASAYIIDDVDFPLAPQMRAGKPLNDYIENNGETPLKLIVSVIDASNKVLVNYAPSYHYYNSSNTDNAIAINESFFFNSISGIGLKKPWSMFNIFDNRISMITKREFYLLISLQPDVLVSAKKIQITLTK